MQIFTEHKLTETDMEVIATSLSNPSVRKYLSNLASADAKDIIQSEPAMGESAESYLRRKAVVQGRLEAINTLLSIQSAVEQASS